VWNFLSLPKLVVHSSTKLLRHPSDSNCCHATSINLLHKTAVHFARSVVFTKTASSSSPAKISRHPLRHKISRRHLRHKISSRHLRHKISSTSSHLHHKISSSHLRHCYITIQMFFPRSVVHLSSSQNFAKISWKKFPLFSRSSPKSS